ncbi:helix-turn-helix domain-containing protein [Chryseobacterium indologenes]|uniref:Transposase n=1 Tax=Chryseobacterium indologenes TaxID=253 RepID=A0A0N0ZXI3_CHRID|nr:helix-turn-helix domain-containing protein [Chryseobacterium indologenes]KPE52940.1 transposase [Chryseobacterium indologenes]
MNFKDIHIGQMIETLVSEQGVEIQRICNFFKSSEEDIQQMYKTKSIDTEVLLKWCKLLEYDFFRVYSQHLILYAPTLPDKERDIKKTSLPQFRKNIYTREVIDYILEEIQTGTMSRTEIMERYKIPKTTLYKWISKYEKPQK